MAAEQNKKLEQQLWNIANTLRGKMDDDFRDYILGFIFYKYLSTKWICMLTPYQNQTV
jgi:type I restriction enzyme M protein